MKDDTEAQGGDIPERSVELAREAEQKAQRADELAQEARDTATQAAELAQEIGGSQTGETGHNSLEQGGAAAGDYGTTGTGAYRYEWDDDTGVTYRDMSELPGENTLEPPWSTPGGGSDDTNTGAS